MLNAFACQDGRLEPLAEAAFERSAWIDLYGPAPDQIDALQALGVAVPLPEEMAEIEPSRRLRRSGDRLTITVFLPGALPDGRLSFAPVSFVLTPERLVSVRYTNVDAIAGFAEQTGREALEAQDPPGIFAELLGEIIGEIAGRLERLGARFDRLAEQVFQDDPHRASDLQANLRDSAQSAERLSSLRQCLLTLERAAAFLQVNGHTGAMIAPVTLEALSHDIKALAAHCEYLSGRSAALTDATLGMIDLAQNRSFAVLSSVTAMFVPPTFIASVYGMNFADMPELNDPWGYEIVIGVMLASVLLAFLLLRWKKLL